MASFDFNPNDFDKMSDAERKALLAKLRKRHAELKRQREEDDEALLDELRNRHEELKRLQAERNQLLDDLIAQPQKTPTPTPEPESVYALPTKRMHQALERFDAMTDAAQLDHLRGLWGR